MFPIWNGCQSVSAGDRRIASAIHVVFDSQRVQEFNWWIVLDNGKLHVTNHYELYNNTSNLTYIYLFFPRHSSKFCLFLTSKGKGKIPYICGNDIYQFLSTCRFIIVSQFPIYVEVINYCMKEAFQFVPMMFVFSFYMFVVALIALTVGRISLIEVIIVVVVVWAVLMIYKHSKITMALRSSILPYYHSNLPLPSEISHTNRPYFPIIVFLLVFEYFLWNRVHPSSPSQTVNRPDLLFGQFQLSFLFLLLGVLMFIGIWMISNHPVSEDHAFWKYVWRVVTIASIFIQLIELFILHSHNELPSFVDRAIIIIVILFVFSNKIVFIIAASLLIVLVFINTIFTYTFWRVPQNAPPVQATPLAMRGLFSQFSLIGTLVYVIAYEL